MKILLMQVFLFDTVYKDGEVGKNTPATMMKK